MSYLSQTGHLGLKTQASTGSFLDPGAVSPNQGVFVYTKSGAFGSNRDLMIPDPEIGGHRDIPDAQLGPISYSGEFDFYVRMEALAMILRGALGTVATAGTALTGYSHTITPADTLPWMSVEENVGNFMVFKYTDAKINTFHMECDANGYISGTMGLIALTQATTTATVLGSQRKDASPLLTGPQITVSWNGANLPAKSFSLDINNNLEDDDFRLGSLFLGDITEKRREVTMGVSIRPQDASLWKTAMWGSPSATAPGGTTLKQQVVVTITSYEDIPNATTGVKYVTTFTLPYVAIAPHQGTVSGDDVMEMDLELRALRPVYATPIVTAVVRNSYVTTN